MFSAFDYRSRSSRAVSFRGNQDGSVAIIFAAVVLVLTMAAGVAMDYARAARLSTITTTALDAAVLAAAKDLAAGASSADVDQTAQNYFNASIANHNLDGISFSNLTVRQDPINDEVNISVQASIETAFVRIAGIDTVSFGERAVAAFASKDIELAMMLDVSGSMGGSKIRDLRDAATDLVDILHNGSPQNDVRIGMVPYSTSVNAGSYADPTTGGASVRCVTERGGGNAFTDISALSDPLGGSGGIYCPNAEIVPITDRERSMKRSIRRLRAGGWTAGHLGVAWAWYMVSPEWADVWPVASRPRAYGLRDNIKAVILMTDGIFNTAYVSGNGDSVAQAEGLCDNMRDEGVVIYSVAFQAPAASEALLRDCADASVRYFDADNGQELREAFQKIALSLLQLRIAE
jgi:Flp pilus assembly protein TadG